MRVPQAAQTSAWSLMYMPQQAQAMFAHLGCIMFAVLGTHASRQCDEHLCADGSCSDLICCCTYAPPVQSLQMRRPCVAVTGQALALKHVHARPVRCWATYAASHEAVGNGTQWSVVVPCSVQVFGRDLTVFLASTSNKSLLRRALQLLP